MDNPKPIATNCHKFNTKKRGRFSKKNDRITIENNPTQLTIVVATVGLIFSIFIFLYLYKNALLYGMSFYFLSINLSNRSFFSLSLFKRASYNSTTLSMGLKV